METIKRNTMRWGRFSVDVFRYIMLAVMTVLLGWLMEVGKEGFKTAEAFDFLKLGVTMILAALNALGALQNSSFHDAKNQTSSTKIELK